MKAIFHSIKDVDFIAGLLANVVTQYQSIVIKEFASVRVMMTIW